MRRSRSSSLFSLSPPEPPSPQRQRQELEPPPNIKMRFLHTLESEHPAVPLGAVDSRLRGNDIKRWRTLGSGALYFFAYARDDGAFCKRPHKCV